ncbi:DNA polymerase III subunit delta [Sulfitobacter mediterraneus]|uniref:DNA polymerase III subunit delta n=1 Tax=Sulfitobacter mediterraneus TaxID=83219 RepID=UPI0019327961|nr:DNA polymerase III subunit delta [Sulfitobacter mediterraneus]MBM1308912.1 DNA polymerase III subunit delta [Sulfitobacter mediterraneus]MBM1312797.1 DNA polymerase III subunit delta [Sulfitobacter mediterraneus]MBM1321179.1 DNA polymerase III subunit delta [Sulfitobacter mediterraneus]MBM1325066.1 DNA polymerase III subunit delta [Sulfitobacter mediterraneus]MBM1396413.1 DNA polymerase III subunit delta [Sulfitobacter mediterraneus]
MKLSPRDANGYFSRPDPDKTGLLIYGSDAMRVALKRQEFLKALLGPNAEEEMRLTRMPAAELRRDPAMLLDAIKAVGFFPGPRAALVEEANDNIAKILIDTLADWQPSDAQIIVTGGDLKKTSKVLKAFQEHRNAYATAIYDTPPDRAEIERLLAEAKLKPEPDAMANLTDLARALDPGDFRQTLEKLALYKLNDTAPLTPDDIAACAPTSTEADVDDILHVVAEARTGDIGPVMSKLQGQGVNPVTLCIMATRHFRTLYRISANPGGPIYGVRDRERVSRQARNWGAARLETALTVLTDTDLKLRSAGQNAPAMALVERAFIRLAMLGTQR